MRHYIFLPKSYKQSELQCEKAVCATPREVVSVIRHSRPVLVTGGVILEDRRLAERAVKLAEKLPVIATGASSKVMVKRGIKPLTCIFTLQHIVQFILDVGWSTIKRYDTAVFLGFKPYYLSRALSTLRHFSSITTISLDEFYQPNAHYSLTAIAMVIEEARCSGCGDCVIACRTASKGLALNIVDGKLAVRPEFCIACGTCVKACGRNAIWFERGDEFYYKMLDEIVRRL